jgi:spermidine synthase
MFEDGYAAGFVVPGHWRLEVANGIIGKLARARQDLCVVRRNDFRNVSEWKMGELPVRMLVPSSARTDLRVASIGLGCGVTLAALLETLSAGSRVEVIELNPMIPAAQKAFWPSLPKTPSDPRVALTIDDGFRHFAARGADAPKYDAVALDVAWMQNMNATHLFSLEMYRNIRRNLADDGVLRCGSRRPTRFPACR